MICKVLTDLKAACFMLALTFLVVLISANAFKSITIEDMGSLPYFVYNETLEAVKYVFGVGIKDTNLRERDITVRIHRD